MYVSRKIYVAIDEPHWLRPMRAKNDVVDLNLLLSLLVLLLLHCFFLSSFVWKCWHDWICGACDYMVNCLATASLFSVSCLLISTHSIALLRLKYSKSHLNCLSTGIKTATPFGFFPPIVTDDNANNVQCSFSAPIIQHTRHGVVMSRCRYLKFSPIRSADTDNQQICPKEKENWMLTRFYFFCFSFATLVIVQQKYARKKTHTQEKN